MTRSEIYDKLNRTKVYLGKYSKEVQISMHFGNLNSLSAFALVVFAISSNGLLSELATNAAV